MIHKTMDWKDSISAFVLNSTKEKADFFSQIWIFQSNSLTLSFL
jgi:hypothetical protein